MRRLARVLPAAFVFFIISLELSALPLRIGVPAGESGLESNRRWSAVVDYLRTRGMDVEFEVFEDHRAVVRNLRDRFIDLAFLDPLWYRRFSGMLSPLAEACGAERKTDTVLIVVPKASIVYSIEGLAGASFALASQKETAGAYFVPLAMLARTGIGFKNLGRVLYAGSSLSVLKGVAYGGVDSGSLTSTVLRSERSGKFAENLRVIAESEPLPPPMLAVRRGDDPGRYRRLRDELVAMDADRQGKAALLESGFSGFVLPVLKEYGTLEKYLLEFEAAYGAQD